MSDQPKLVNPLQDIIVLLVLFILFFELIGSVEAFVLTTCLYFAKYLNLILSKNTLVTGFKVIFFSWLVVVLISTLTGWYTNYHLLFLIGIPTLWMTVSPYFKEEQLPPPATLVDEIKQDFGITYVVSKEISFPKAFRWVGGFITPAFPFLSVVNTDWVKKENELEAKIHEHVHLYLLLNRGYLIFGILLTAGISILTSFISLPIAARTTEIVLISLLLVIFEKATFDMTREYAIHKFNVETRKFTRQIGFTYFILYCINIAVVMLFIFGVTALISYIGGKFV